MKKNEAKSSVFADGRFLIRESSRFHHKTNTNKLTQQRLNTLMSIKYKQFYMPTKNYLKKSLILTTKGKLNPTYKISSQ